MQFGPDFVWCRVEHRRIAGPPWSDGPLYRAPGHALDRLDGLADRVGRAGAQIIGRGAPRLRKRVERLHMRIGKVGDVDVISEAGAVRGGIVVAEHLQFAATGGGLDGARDEVNLGRVIFTDLAVRIGTSRVEVAQ